MFTDVVQLKLEKPATESDEGIPLASLGKYFNLKLLFSLFLVYLY